MPDRCVAVSTCRSLHIIAAALAIDATFLLPTQALPGGEFFPIRPAHATASTSEGVLFDYGVGNKAGGVRLRERSGVVHDYYLGGDLRVDGHHVRCAWPPEPGFFPGKAMCEEWPAYLVLRITRVRVSSFDAVRMGEHVHVVDRIDVIDRDDYHGTFPMTPKR